VLSTLISFQHLLSSFISSQSIYPLCDSSVTSSCKLPSPIILAVGVIPPYLWLSISQYCTFTIIHTLLLVLLTPKGIFQDYEHETFALFSTGVEELYSFPVKVSYDGQLARSCNLL